jgi:hypothetical protein
MNLLGAKLYDPGSAVSKSTASLLAMTAFDTTNLRITCTVPAHGMVRFRIRCAITGATTTPSIMLGVLNGATVVGRVAPLLQQVTNNVATTIVVADAEFTATGLTPGSTNFDAAYGVEVVVASTNIKYGGPNNTTTNDAWGAFVFEVWDPQPQTTTGQLSVDANGRVDVIKIAGTTQTARDIGASVLLSSGTGTGQLDFTSGVVKANATQILGTTVSTPATAGVLDVNVKNINNTAAATPGAAGGVLISGSNSGTTTLGAFTVSGAFTANITGNLSGSVGSVTGSVGSVTGAVGSVTGAVGSVTGSVGSVTGLTASNLDVAVSTRLASASYTAPDNASISLIAGYTDSIESRIPAALVGGRMDSVAAVVSDKTGYSLTQSFPSNFSSLAISTTGAASADVSYVNGIPVSGSGTEADPWGP